MSTYLEFGALLLQEMQLQNVSVSVDDYGAFSARINGLDIQLIADRLFKDYAQNKNPDAIKHFVDQLKSASHDFTAWKDARKRIYAMVESSDWEFGNNIKQNLSQQLTSVLVFLFPEDSGIVYLTAKHVKKWGQSTQSVQQLGVNNLSALAEKTKFHVQEFDKFRLGMFITESPLKASLVFSPNLGDIAEPSLGWPVLAAVPCRDFAYVIPERDAEFLPRLRPVIISEYLRSGYPLSTEIIRIADDGITVIDRFGSDFSADEFEEEP